MLKKIAILAILTTLFICGNLVAADELDLHVWVWAQDELTWTLDVEGFESITKTGDYDTVRPYWGGHNWEIWVFGDLKLSGTFPYYGHYDIEIPICIPSNEDPEE